jgi:hypothetical protein
MRAAVCLLLAGLAAAIPADPRPIHLQTSGSAYAFNTTGHQEIASADAPGLLGWTMYKQCDSAVSSRILGAVCWKSTLFVAFVVAFSAAVVERGQARAACARSECMTGVTLRRDRAAPAALSRCITPRIRFRCPSWLCILLHVCCRCLMLQWANDRLGTCSLTICQAGCAMRSVNSDSSS